MAPTGFIPAQPNRPLGLLARYRPAEMADAARGFIAQLTAPGDLVVDLFCHGPAFVREAVLAGRRAVGASVNPLALLAAGLALEPPSPAVTPAFTRLADSPKGAVPLHRHMADLYRSRCPDCQGEGVAVWFAWDRDLRTPYAKAVRCTRCAGVREGPADPEDVAGAGRLAPRGLAYHYALNRAVPADHPDRERVAELVDIYTPRNLSALMDVTLRLEGLNLERPVRALLQGALVEAFDHGTSLDPHGEVRSRPRSLRPPARFLERNVWLLLEQEVADLASAEPPPVVPRAESLAVLLAERAPGYTLLPAAAREVTARLPASAVSLILADPPRPDGVFWALCALWATWLWDSPAAHALRPFLSRRRFDWEWHSEMLQRALAAVAPLLAPDACLVTLFAASDEMLMESVCRAAPRAGFVLSGWGADPTMGYQLVWQRVSAKARPVPALAEPAALARQCLEARGEPTPWRVLHAAACIGLTRQEPPLSTLPTQEVAQMLEGMGLEPLGGPRSLYWLPVLDEQQLEPLADRVELWVWEALRSRPTWSASDFLGALYRHFSGPLTPDLPLVLTCLDSYAQWDGEVWRLREEDRSRSRAEEMQALQRDLRVLGRRLGFHVAAGQGWDVRWQERGSDRFLFTLSPTAALGRHLLAGPPIPAGARPCLVFPGGRAELLAYKLQRDPRLAQAAQAHGWQFIKFRHLRRLIAEGLDRQSFTVLLGLDPIVGRAEVQIPMVMGGEG